MAESKQYITQIQENGAVQISEDVIGSIVEVAVREVEGVDGLSGKIGADLAELLGKKNWGNGVKLTIAENGELTISCNIIVKYGYPVVTVAQGVQDSIGNAVEAMTGCHVAAVNVNICGISQAEKQTER